MFSPMVVANSVGSWLTSPTIERRKRSCKEVAMGFQGFEGRIRAQAACRQACRQAGRESGKQGRTPLFWMY